MGQFEYGGPERAIQQADWLRETANVYHRLMGGWQAFFWVLGALFALANLIMALARTPPHDAMSNLAKWADWVGIHHIPLWLRDRRADQVAYRWARAAAIIVAVGAVGVTLGYLSIMSPVL